MAIPSLSCKMVEMTASSSTGFNEQVEYTIWPPIHKSSSPRLNNRNCKLLFKKNKKKEIK